MKIDLGEKMDLLTAIEKRASVRKFTKDPVSQDDLKEMIRRAGLAPSINNSQPWIFYSITNQNILQAMAREVKLKIDELFPESEGTDAQAKATVNFFSTIFVNAPALVAVAVKPYEAISDKLLTHSELTHDDMNALRNYPDVQSIGACVQNLLLSAVDMGYGACWLSGMLVAREELQNILKIESPYRLVTFVAVGHTEGETKPKPKKSVDEIYIPVE